LISAAGWRGAFMVLGGIGVLFSIFWFFAFRDDPEEHPMVSEKEIKHIHETRQQLDTTESASLLFGTILKSKQAWLAMGQYFCSNFVFFFCLTWLYPYVKTTYNLTSSEAAFWTALPWISGAFGNWISGWLVDRLLVAKGLIVSSRLPAMIGFALAAVGLLGSLQMDTAMGAVAFLTIAVLGADMTLSPSWSFCVDIGGRSAGAVSGTMNIAGNLGSFATTLAFPYLKEALGSTEPFFYISAGLCVIAIFCWMKANPKEKIS
jgi:ACS family glucarate transporter-like MFS transporter